MSNKDFDQQFAELFNEPLPEPDQQRKKAAINSATAEFSQGFAKQARPTSESEAKPGFAALLRSLFMSPINNKLAYGAFGSFAVAFLVFSVFLFLPKNPLQKVDSVIIATETKTSPEPRPASVITPADGLDGRQRLDGQNNATAGQLEEVVVSANRVTAADQDLAVRGPQAVSRSRPALQETEPAPMPQPSKDKLRKVESRAAAKPIENLAAGTLAQESVANTAPLAHTSPARAKKQSEDMSSAYSPTLTSPQVIAHPPVGDDLKRQAREDDREEYAEYQSNPIVQVAEQPVSTFSIDVDTASYSLVRSQLNNGYLPKPQAVRAEELINYFDYAYPLPQAKNTPFKPTVSVLNSPWNDGRKLVHIGIKGYDIDTTAQPDSNLVFLLDVSGSMNQANKLPLVKQSMALLLETLKPTDLVSIVVYAGAAGVVLEPTAAKEESKIMAALQGLNAGGSTAGGAGIRLAYQLAEQNLKKEGVNRIILATDGDFNVGQSSNEDLKTLVERKRDNGVFLSVLGFGRNNYQDDMMQTLAQNGNGVAAYIDTLSEAKKVLVDEATSTLFPIAKDVKIQVEFNPEAVSEYRLIGYETRALQREDFNNDKVDAGDIGAGHTVTAIYEITPANSNAKAVDDLRYKKEKRVAQQEPSEYGFLKMRYKLPNESKSRLIETPISNKLNEQNDEAQFSIAVAGFAQLLTNSKYVGDLSYDDIIQQAQKYKGKDEFGYRAEFIQLARMAKIAKP